MRTSLRLNNDLTVGEYVALARAAEGAGFDQFWISNDLFLRSSVVLLGAVARATTRLEVGTCILNPHTIHPAEMAMMAATMDELSGCRFNLGVAAGAADFLRWIDIEDPRPVRTMRAAITDIRALLAGEPMPSGGAGAYLRFRAPRVTPIYLGAMGPNMLRLAGEVADGALPLLHPPEHWATVAPLLAEGTARRAPGLGPLDVAACLWVSLGDDPGAARRALAEKIAYYGHALGPLILDRLGVRRAEFEAIERALTMERDMDRAASLVTERMLAVGVCGGPAALVARLEPLLHAGVHHLSFGPPLGPDPLRAVELLGQEVLPRLGARCA
jgi:5,10-methylenetetrahydromethanopterin reductase